MVKVKKDLFFISKINIKFKNQQEFISYKSGTMNKKTVFFVLLALVTLVSGLQARTDKKLTRLLELQTAAFKGVIGVYVKNLRTGSEACVNADTVFPTASTIKVPIMVGVFDKMEEKRTELLPDVDLHQ